MPRSTTIGLSMGDLMGDNEKQPDDLFGNLVQGLEEELNAKSLEKKGVYALACARIVGAVYTEAVASGVPADLSKDMATDTWMGLMGVQVVTVSESEAE